MCFFVADPAKAAANRRKHGVTFAEAATVLDDPVVVERSDDAHAHRWIAIGLRPRPALYVVYAIVGPAIGRIISARRATAHERKRHEEEG